ncbi:MAG: aromatic ring-hydroxylating dioxygenase subunit alpha, partial [Bacteroidota bacterium]
RYGEKGEIVLLTTLTPISENQTELNQFLYTNIPLVNILFHVLRPIGKIFINQDVQVIKKQKEGLKYDPPLMLVGEADQQARWYYQLKENFSKAAKEKKPIEHPLKEETILTWYS